MKVFINVGDKQWDETDSTVDDYVSVGRFDSDFFRRKFRYIQCYLKSKAKYTY